MNKKLLGGLQSVIAYSGQCTCLHLHWSSNLKLSALVFGNTLHAFKNYLLGNQNTLMKVSCSISSKYNRNEVAVKHVNLITCSRVSKIYNFFKGDEINVVGRIDGTCLAVDLKIFDRKKFANWSTINCIERPLIMSRLTLAVVKFLIWSDQAPSRVIWSFSSRQRNYATTRRFLLLILFQSQSLQNINSQMSVAGCYNNQIKWK